MKSLNNVSNCVAAVALALVPCFAMAKETPPANRVPIEKARAAATRAFHGGIQGEELEFEGGKWIYSFDLKTSKDKRVHEVHVDALSGKVLDIHTESASDEQKEVAEDAKEN
jgi:hypothetical protein